MNKLGLLAAALFCAAAGALGAQPKAALTGQLSVFWDVRIGTPEENSKYAEIIARSALISFEMKGFKPVPEGELEALLPSFDRSRPLEEAVVPRLLEKAKEKGSSFAVLIAYREAAAEAVLEMRAWDLNGRGFFQAAEKARTGLELLNRLNDNVAALASGAGKVKTVVPEPPIKTENENPAAKKYVRQIILLSGDEGCEIYVDGVIKVGVIAGGRLVLFIPLEVGSRLSLEKRKPGFFSDVEEFNLNAERVELLLRSLERIVSHELQFTYTVGQFMGFGLGYQLYLIPRHICLGLENYFYLQISDVLGSHTVIHDDVRLTAGLYLISVPNVPIRVGIATGLGCIFTVLLMPDNPLYTDLYFNLINIMVEYRIGEFLFFIREEMKIGLAVTNNLLGGGFYFIRGEIPIFSFGIRIAL